MNQRIFHILNTYLQPNTTLSPSNVAQEIDKLFPLNRPREEDTRENEEPESFLFEMWEVIISVAEQIPWKHSGQTRLVEVIQALKDLPGSTTLKFDYWSDMELWSDLPMLGAVMTEKCYCMRFIFSYCCFCLIFHWHCYSHRSGRYFGCPGSYSHLPTQLRSILSTSHAERSR